MSDIFCQKITLNELKSLSDEEIKLLSTKAGTSRFVKFKVGGHRMSGEQNAKLRKISALELTFPCQVMFKIRYNPN